MKDLVQAAVTGHKLLESVSDSSPDEVLEIAAVCAFLLGETSAESDNTQAASEWYGAAERFGSLAGTTMGLRTSVSALFASDKTVEALEAFEQVAVAAPDSVSLGPIGGDSLAASDVQLPKETLSALRKVWDASVELGKKSRQPADLELAAAAAIGIRSLAHGEGNKQKARRSLEQAVDFGTRAGTPKGLETAARSAADLLADMDPNDSPRAYSKALQRGIWRALLINPPYGLELAAKLGFNLAVLYLHRKKLWRARGALRFTCVYGQKSQTPLGLEQTP